MSRDHRAMSTSPRFPPILLVAVAIGCRSSAERARIEMQSVYRSAKAVDGRLKAGADLNELHKLEGNLATELAFVHYRIRSGPSMDKLLRRDYAAYQSVLESYTLSRTSSNTATPATGALGQDTNPQTRRLSTSGMCPPRDPSINEWHYS